MSARELTITLLLLMGILSSGTVLGGPTAQDIKTDPEPRAGVPFKVSCIVRSDLGHGPDLVEIGMGDTMVTMLPRPGEVNWSSGVRYTGTLRIDEPGNKTLTLRIGWGEGNLTYEHHIVVKRADDDGKKNNRLLGLPRWYCAASIIFLTIFIMFLTFAYFKGRSLQREKGEIFTKGYEFCSSCGGISPRMNGNCPSCGEPFMGSIEVCGRCGAKLTEGTNSCPGCGTALMRTDH